MGKNNKSTNVYKFFLTLRKVNVVDSKISIEIVFEHIRELFTGDVKLFGVKELHSDGSRYHFHIIIFRVRGISKNSYKGIFRKRFSMFTGRGIDVRGIKNITHTIRYLLKHIKDLREVRLFNTSIDEMLKWSKINEIIILNRMKKYKDFERWKNASLENRCLYYKHPKKVKLIWEDAMIDRATTLRDVRKRMGRSLVQDYSPKVKELLTTPWVILFLLKFCSALLFPHQWKRTNLLVVGTPNCGKTSFFKKFESCFNIEFYWGSSRVGDFSGLSSKHSIIVLDDVITRDHKWPMAMLLKLLGSEGLKGDAKMSSLVTINKGVPVAVITNFPLVFSSLPIKARLCLLYFIGRVDWLSISDQEFKDLIRFTQDVSATLKMYNNELYNSLLYLNDPSQLVRDSRFKALWCELNTILGNKQPHPIKESRWVTWSRFAE